MVFMAFADFIQFKERYLELFGEGQASQPVKKSASMKLKTLLRELSSDDDEPSSSSATPVDPLRPWQKEFYQYFNTVDELNGLSIVQWWGVSQLYYVRVLLMFFALDE